MQRKSGCLSGCARSVLLIGAVGAFAFGLHSIGERIDIWRFPWGHAESGRPTLTGTWVGPVTTGSGKHLAMLIWTELAPLDRGRRWPGPIIRSRRTRWLEGHALVCSIPGRATRYKVRGEPYDERAASRFHLALYPADSVPPDGLAPSHIQGRWGSGDSVALAVSLYLRRGKSAISSSDDPDTGRDTQATLRHGTEAQFNSLCAQAR